MPILEIKVSQGLAKLKSAFQKAPDVMIKRFEEAGLESLALVLNTVGIRSYPPETAANRPPVPFYNRGTGTQTAFGNLKNSEEYGKKWTEKSEGLVAKARNSASYAKYLGGEKQVHWASGYGWKKLFSTAKELMPKILQIYTGKIGEAIKELGF